MSEPDSQTKDFAFYYPGHLWRSSDWVKTMLLYFDSLALLVPNHEHNDLERRFPEIAIPLMEQGLLQTIVPEEQVDATATQQLADALLPIIDSDALDDLDRSESAFSSFSRSRLVFAGDEEIAHPLHGALKARGLAQDGGEFSFPLQEQVRALVLTLVAQILRTRASGEGLRLQPATDQPEMIASLVELLELRSVPTAGHVVTADFQEIGVDLGPVPFDEVLDFRRQFGALHRDYAHEVRLFVHDLSMMDADLRRMEMAGRREKLRDLATDLRQHATQAWKRPATVGLSLAGAVWTAWSGDPWGALLATGAAATSIGAAEPSPAGAYSYLFRAARQFG
ncbi:MAG: hypothetical protein N838_15270 [Thiohalocapsa sp. PB-PSB1]|jgi:hypothetical protein|nr:MAG: hypothetical protein N838_26190 [Thiohalocapsa sp. PB-PSB1]QQO54502.1 MAG: hypothetical protein N838_15270 [Thiohalocapsa sp. PB-PSB1]HCS88907.1 hypothetical protein [Chromatiaceae bacterium]